MRWPLLERLTSALACVLGGALAVVAPAFAAQEFDCVIEPSRTVLVGSPVSGILTSVKVGRGDRITEGQVIAELEDRVERATRDLQQFRVGDVASIEAQRARLALAQERQRRAETLLQRGSGTRDTYDQAQAELLVNQAELDRLEMQREIAGMELARSEAVLSLRTITSPMDGIVTAQVLSRGEFVDQDAHILSVVEINPLHVEVFLPAGYYEQLALGDTATVMANQPSGTTLTGQIEVVDRVFDASSNTFGIRVAVQNEGDVVPAGQRCRVVLDVEPLGEDGLFPSGG